MCCIQEHVCSYGICTAGSGSRSAAHSLKHTPRAQNMRSCPRATLCATNFRAILRLLLCKGLSVKSRVLHVAVLADLAPSINVPLKCPLKLNSKLHETNSQGINPRAKHLFPHCDSLVPSLLSVKGWQPAELSATTVFGSIEHTQTLLPVQNLCTYPATNPGTHRPGSVAGSWTGHIHQVWLHPQILMGLKAALGWEVSLLKAHRISLN